MLKNTIVVMPIGDISDEILAGTFSTVKNNLDRIKKIIIINENNDSIIDEFVKNNFEDVTFIMEKISKSTKMQKLQLSKKFIEDDEMVIVLDADDNLIRIPEIKENTDLFLTNIYRETKSGMKKLIKFDRKNINWTFNKFPYFGNHNIIVKGFIFKNVCNLFMNSNFQRNEDACRTMLYISFSENVYFSRKKNDIFIYRRFHKGHQHTSRVNSPNLKMWMENLLVQLSNFEINYKEVNPILFKSQISSLNEMISTVKKNEIDIEKDVMEILESILIEKKKIFSELYWNLTN